MRLRFAVACLAILCGGLLPASEGGHSAPVETPSPTLPAKAVVDQIGVVIHLSFFDTAYNKFDSIVRPRLLDLGIRHIRDGALTNGNSGTLGTYYKRLSTLAADGIKSCLVVFDATTPAYLTDLSKLEQIYDSAGHGVECFEGANEPNLKSNARWAEIGKNRQKELYEAVHSNPRLSHIAVLGPSPWGESAQRLGDVSAFVDYGNWHTYSGGQNPEWAGKSGVGDYLAQATGLYRNKRVITTEAGYHSAMNVPPRKHRPTPEDIVARYMPRMILWNLKSGFVRSYIYELIDTHSKGDTDPESNFGLIRPDGSPKPSYFAVKNLIRIFSDSGTVSNLREINWSISSRTSDIKSLLFQKSDGSHLLALWLGVPAWDPDRRERIEVAPVATELTLPASINKAIVSQFSDDGTVSERETPLRNGKLNLTVSDKLTVIRLQ